MLGLALQKMKQPSGVRMSSICGVVVVFCVVNVACCCSCFVGNVICGT